MGPGYERYWGKADPKVGGHHLLAFHALDVAAVASGMIDRDAALRSRLTSAFGVSIDVLRPLLLAAITLHDVGKLDVRFQDKAREVGRALDPARARFQARPSPGYDHGVWGFRQVAKELKGALESALGNVAEPLLRATTAHHGAIPSRAEPPADDGWFRAKDVQTTDREARADFARDVLSLFAPSPLDREVSLRDLVLVAGLCSVADWIGSQTDHFPYVGSTMPLATYWETRSKPQAEGALDALRWSGAKASGRPFTELFPGKSPRDLQVLTETMPLVPGPALVVIEAQMGMGKTEAALSLAGRFLAAGSASGLFIALPTMATSNAMLARILDAAPRLFTDNAVNVVLSHGRARHNWAFSELLKKTADADYGNAFLERSAEAGYEDEAGVVCARWFAGRKRALLSQVGVGTIDQAMQAAMRVKHHFVRATGLASQVVVLDEIHAYDAYMSVILHRLLEWLGALGAPTILLSATLPAERRAAFADSYARGAFGTSRPSSEISTTAPYPLVTMIDREGTRTFALDSPPLDRSVTVELRATSSPEADVLPELVRAVQAGARVAWIRNTVGEAQEAWEAARASIPGALLFHARMRGCDRQKIENHVIETFGRGGPAGGTLLLATQVVEQSLDLDFDLLVTDLAPIDLVLQRSGRLHRHHRVRPVGFEVPRLVVVMPPHEETAGLRFGLSRYVYDVATLWLAKDSLQSANGALQVPSCIRSLVEATYNSSQRAARIEASTSRDKLVLAEEARQKKTGELEAKARTFCVAHAATDPVANDPVSDDDEHLQAMTRDGASTTLLPILWDAEAGVGSSLSGISWTLDPEAPSAFHEARLLSDETVRVPHTDLEAGVRPRGEAADWEAWHARMRSFLKVVGVGEPLIVQMRAQREAGAGFAGRILKRNGKALRVRYSLEKGLWFPKEDG